MNRLLSALEAEQDRWFLWTPVLFGLGVAAYFLLPTEPAFITSLTPAIAAFVVHLTWRSGRAAVLATSAALALSFGFAAAKVRTEWVRSPVLDRPLSNVEVRGFVELVEPRPTRGHRLTVRVVKLGNLEPAQRPYRVRVHFRSPAPGLAAGHAVRFRANLVRPGMPVIPDGYDFARAAYFQRLGAVGFAPVGAERDGEAGRPPLDLVISGAIARVRQSIGQRIVAALPGENGAIANALITGERGGISERTNDAFRDSGLYHILSISGLHMAIMAGAVFFAVRFVLAALPSLALRISTKKCAAVVAALAALGYLLISGASFATVRSYIMISIMFLAMLLDRPALALRNVAVSALIILVLFPDSVFDAGFQMSFAAVVALVAAYEAIRDSRSGQPQGTLTAGFYRIAFFLGGIILSTVIASAAVAPFAAYHFHKTQQFAVLANLIAIPICNVIVMPAALATLVLMPFGLEALPLWLAGAGVDAMIWCAYAVAALPGAVGRIPAIPGAAFVLMVFGLLWLTLWRRRWRFLGLALVAAGIGVAPFNVLPDALVGRDGDLLAIRTPERSLAAASNSARGTSFELQRWLEHDGDPRQPRQVIGADALRCDGVGCIGEVRGRTIALAKHAAALGDDCRRARILVLPFPRPKGCAAPELVIDFFAVRDKGTHALYIGPDAVLVRTVAEARGRRPWSESSRSRLADLTRRRVPLRGSRLDAFAAPDLSGSADGLRPDSEEDDRALLQDEG